MTGVVGAVPGYYTAAAKQCSSCDIVDEPPTTVVDADIGRQVALLQIVGNVEEVVVSITVGRKQGMAESKVVIEEKELVALRVAIGGSAEACSGGCGVPVGSQIGGTVV